MKDKTITVIGLGYIGLPTASILASKGYSVSGYDTNKDIVKEINNGKSHIYEPDLDKYLADAIKSKKMKAYSKLQPSDIYIICVPTPFYENSYPPKPNIEYVISAANEISKVIKSGDLVILESTSPVGTTQKLSETLKNNGTDISSIYISYCPERVLPGNIINEFIKNDRLVGGINKTSSKVTRDFYRDFVDGEIFITDDKTAEMCKLTENSFRDLNIAFANELSIICDQNGINVDELISFSNKHPRVNILQPGPGVGGHCIAVDPWFIVDLDEENSKLIKLSRERNVYKTQWTIKKISNEIKKFIKNHKRPPLISFLGISFKPNIDDLRESPALEIAYHFHKSNNVVVCEPNIDTHESLNLVSIDKVKESDLVVGLVKHDQFLDINFQENLKKINFIDFCGIQENLDRL